MCNKYGVNYMHLRTIISTKVFCDTPDYFETDFIFGNLPSGSAKLQEFLFCLLVYYNVASVYIHTFKGKTYR